jgi:hypothetical protein
VIGSGSGLNASFHRKRTRRDSIRYAAPSRCDRSPQTISTLAPLPRQTSHRGRQIASGRCAASPQQMSAYRNSLFHPKNICSAHKNSLIQNRHTPRELTVENGSLGTAPQPQHLVASYDPIFLAPSSNDKHRAWGNSSPLPMDGPGPGGGRLLDRAYSGLFQFISSG